MRNVYLCCSVQTWYPSELQATFYRAARGDHLLDLTFTFHLHNCHLNQYHHDRRLALRRSQDDMASFQSGNRGRQLVNHTLTHMHTRSAQTLTRTHRQDKQYVNIHRFVCRRVFGSCFLCSSSACRRILVVVVRAQKNIFNLVLRPHHNSVS